MLPSDSNENKALGGRQAPFYKKREAKASDRLHPRRNQSWKDGERRWTQENKQREWVLQGNQAFFNQAGSTKNIFSHYLQKHPMPTHIDTQHSGTSLPCCLAVCIYKAPWPLLKSKGGENLISLTCQLSLSTDQGYQCQSLSRQQPLKSITLQADSLEAKTSAPGVVVQDDPSIQQVEAGGL